MEGVSSAGAPRRSDATLSPERLRVIPYTFPKYDLLQTIHVEAVSLAAVGNPGWMKIEVYLRVYRLY